VDYSSGFYTLFWHPNCNFGFLNLLAVVVHQDDEGKGQTQVYAFDAMGNRLQRQDSASGATTYAYNAANMLLSTGGAGASGFNNDADGNTLSGNGRTNAWDSQNRLVSCIVGGNTTAYKYGAEGLRRQATKNGASTDYAYDAKIMVREGHASGGSLTPATVTATYLIGARGPEYRRDDTQTEVDSQGRTVTKARWYVFDGLGSVVGEVDPLGNLTSSPRYDVYGATRNNGGTSSSKQGFVGSLEHISDDTGLVYMRARYYDPNLGRFASEDPGRHGLNWFAYCNDNPVNYIDRDGKLPQWLVTVIEALTLILVAGVVVAAVSALDEAILATLTALCLVALDIVYWAAIVAIGVGLVLALYGVYLGLNALGQAIANLIPSTFIIPFIAGFGEGEALAIAEFGLDSAAHPDE